MARPARTRRRRPPCAASTLRDGAGRRVTRWPASLNPIAASAASMRRRNPRGRMDGGARTRMRTRACRRQVRRTRRIKHDHRHAPRPALRDPGASRTAAALRFPPRTRRHAEVMGGAERAERRPVGEAAGRARRGSSARICVVRRRDPGRPLRRGTGHRVGRGHVDARRRHRPGARRLPRGQADVPARRHEAARRLGAGAQRAAARTPGAMAADQGTRRRRARCGQLRCRRAAAGQRACRPDKGGAQGACPPAA